MEDVVGRVLSTVDRSWRSQFGIAQAKFKKNRNNFVGKLY